MQLCITSSYQAYFLPFSFSIYDNLTSDYVPGLQKYDMCMTEQVPGPQRVKIVGRHIASAPNRNHIIVPTLRFTAGEKNVYLFRGASKNHHLFSSQVLSAPLWLCCEALHPVDLLHLLKAAFFSMYIYLFLRTKCVEPYNLNSFTKTQSDI